MPLGQLQQFQPFAHLAEQARRRPGSIALIAPNRVLTYRQLLEHTTRLAGALRRLGVRPGDVVATQLDSDLNIILMPALFHEAAVGCIYPRALGPDAPDLFDWVLAYQPSPHFARDKTIVVDQAFMESVAGEPLTIAPHSYEGFDAPCRIIFSSGTTGIPTPLPNTIAMSEDRALLREATQLRTQPFMTLLIPTSASGYIAAYTAFATGDTYYCPGTPQESIAIIRDNYVAGVQGSPAQISEFVEAARQLHDPLDSVELISLVGGHVSAQLVTAIREVLGARIVGYYAATGGGMAAVTDFADGNEPGDVGVIMDDVELEIVDESDSPVPVNEVGAIRWRRAVMADVRFGRHQTLSPTVRDGWFYPGDRGRLTREGRLVLVGRSAELLNLGGTTLNPAMLDDFLRSLPGVIDAAAIGYTRASGLDGLILAYVAEAGVDLAQFRDAIRNECMGVTPDHLVRVEAITRNAAGKVQRREMGEALAERLLASSSSPVAGAVRNVVT